MTHRRVRTTIGTTSLIALALLLSTACGGGGDAEGAAGPAATVQTFYGHLNAERFDEALALYDAETRAVLTDPDATGEEGFAGWARQTTKNGTIEKVEIVSESEIEGDDGGVKVEYDVRFADGSTSRHSVTVREIDRGWRLGFIG